MFWYLWLAFMVGLHMVVLLPDEQLEVVQSIISCTLVLCLAWMAVRGITSPKEPKHGQEDLAFIPRQTRTAEAMSVPPR